MQNNVLKRTISFFDCPTLKFFDERTLKQVLLIGCPETADCCFSILDFFIFFYYELIVVTLVTCPNQCQTLCAEMLRPSRLILHLLEKTPMFCMLIPNVFWSTVLLKDAFIVPKYNQRFQLTIGNYVPRFPLSPFFSSICLTSFKWNWTIWLPPQSTKLNPVFLTLSLFLEDKAWDIGGWTHLCVLLMYSK